MQLYCDITFVKLYDQAMLGRASARGFIHTVNKIEIK